MNKNKIRKLNYKKVIKVELAILTVFALIGVGKLAYSIPAVKEAVVMATTVKPETFTELYFEDHINLPKVVAPGKPYSFVFTLHNLEYKDMDYPYLVYVQRGGQKIVLDQGQVSLKANEYKSVKETFGPLKNLRSEVVVELTSKNQQIDFWLEKI